VVVERTNVAVRCAGNGVTVAAIVAVCLAASGCATGRTAGTIAPTVKKEVAKEQTITLPIPDSIGGFTLVDRHTFEDPALGSRLRYAGGDSMSADLFLYPGPAVGAPCDTGMALQAMADQIAGFREGFPTMIERHYVDEIAVASDDRLEPAAGARWCAGRHLTLDVIRDGTPQHSDYYLYVLSGYFVKVRITYRFSDARLALEQAFVADLFTRLVPRQ
jgi:hypothetical protein